MTPLLWGRASSVNVQKVMWALAECNIGHKRIDAGFNHGRTDTPEFQKLNPMRRVPVWQDSEVTLWESHVILRHLARGPAANLWPSEPKLQAMADLWMEFTTTTLLPPFIGVFYQKVRHAPQDRSENAFAKHLDALDTALDVLETRLSTSEYLVGDTLTMADIATGTPMFRYHDMELSRPARPSLSNWYARLCERAAYRTTVMTSYDVLRAS